MGQKRITKPDARVISILAHDYPNHILTCCDSPEDAVKLYEAAKNLPGSQTRVALLTHGIVFLGCATPFPGNVWKVINSNTSVIKILKVDSNDGKEISAYSNLFSSPNDTEATLSANNLVFCSVINVEVDRKASMSTELPEKTIKGLLMNKYEVLANLPLLSDEAIFNGAM